MEQHMLASFPYLTNLIFLPIVGAIILMVLKVDDTASRFITLCIGIVETLLALTLLGGFVIGNAGWQFVELHPWMPEAGLTYHLAVDGLSLFMVVLSAVLLPLCTLCSWTYISKRVKEFHVCLLLMTGACVGVFVAMDLVLFYIFWEAMLVPMYLLIAVWGGPRRRYASIKFFLYTLAGSTLLLAAIVALYVHEGTFSIPQLMQGQYGFDFQCWVFLAMALAFAIKVPMFPFHTWLPAAHVEAPSAGSVLLASVLLKMGTYGFLRFCIGLTPMAADHYAPMFLAISIASILYGGFVALGQQDMKKLIAYSSVAHMGFVTLGIFAFTQAGVEGALMVMLNHGIVTGGLFMMVGAIYERSHSREIDDNMGLGKHLPAFMGFFGLFSLASLGFPGLNSFVGELLVLIGTFEMNTSIGLAAIPGAMLAAAYMLRLGLRMAYGQPASPAGKGWSDLNLREWIYLAPLAVLTLYLGLAPALALKVVTPSVEKLLADYRAKTCVILQAEAEPASAAIELSGKTQGEVR
ncbi:NADH-quinone oxidoreductase subunit M [Megalodesulfovibrio paquesii]